MCILCQMSPVYFFLLFPQQNCFFFFWNTLNADFRLKCAPLFSLLPSFFLFLALLCYLLPIGLTLAHCSLAFCQTWFLTPASSLFFFLFLLCCHGSFSLSPLVFFLFPSILPYLHVSSGKDSSGIPFSCFFRAVTLFPSHLSISLVRMLFVRN